MLQWISKFALTWLRKTFPAYSALLEASEEVITFCFEAISSAPNKAASDSEQKQIALKLQAWLKAKNTNIDYVVCVAIVGVLVEVLNAWFKPFLARLEERVKAYIAEQVLKGVAPWLARMAEKPLKHPPDSLQLSTDLLNQLQSRSGKSWDKMGPTKQLKTGLDAIDHSVDALKQFDSLLNPKLPGT